MAGKSRKSSEGKVTIDVPKPGKYNIRVELLCGAPSARASKGQNTLYVPNPGKYEMCLAPTTAVAGGDWMDWLGSKGMSRADLISNVADLNRLKARLEEKIRPKERITKRIRQIKRRRYR